MMIYGIKFNQNMLLGHFEGDGKEKRKEESHDLNNRGDLPTSQWFCS